MSLKQKEMNGSSATLGSTFPNQKQVSLWDGITVIFGTDASETLLDYCAPVGYNKSTGKYAPWTAPDAPSIIVDVSEATEGSWTLTVGGVTTANIAYNATASVVQQALVGINRSADVTITSGVYTIVFTDEDSIENAPTVTGTVSGITGGSPTAVATAGTASNGTHLIKGFAWSEQIQLDETEEVQGVIMVEGRIRYSDIADTVDTGDLTALQAELRKTPLGRGVIVEGLVNQY